MRKANMLTFALCTTRALSQRASHTVPLSSNVSCHFHTASTFLAAGGVGRRRTRYLSPTIARMVVEDTVVQAPEEEEVDPGVIEGTDLRVLRYPHPLLRAANAEIGPDEFDDSLRKMAREMLLVMYASRGVGLAAPQVGINKRLMVFNPDGDSRKFVQEVVLVNPKIIASSKKTDVELEACLSFPGMRGEVRRNVWVKVEAYRLNGKKFRVKYEGWVARIFQHEYDHLEGKMYIDRLVSGEEDEAIEKRLEELISEYRADPFEGLEPAV